MAENDPKRKLVEVFANIVAAGNSTPTEKMRAALVVAALSGNFTEPTINALRKIVNGDPN